MSEFSDTSKKITAGAIAGTIAVTGGIAVTHNLTDKEPEYLETTSSTKQEYKNELPSNSNVIQIGDKTFILNDATTGIFATITETTIPNTIQTTKSLEEMLQDRIVAPSDFNSLEELYDHYAKIWNTKNAGNSAIEIIDQVDFVDGDDLKIAAALAYLNEVGVNPLDLMDQLNHIQVCGLVGTGGIDPRIEEKLVPLFELFPKEFTRAMIIKSYRPLAKELTALLEVKLNHVVAVEYKDSYLTPEIASLALSYDILEKDKYVIDFLEKQNGKEITVENNLVRK